MTIKPFAIQGADLTLGGVNLQAGTTGVVIPGVTQATGYGVEEVKDVDVQTDTLTKEIVIDNVVYTAKVANASANVSAYAVYAVSLDDNNYIDEIEVTSNGSYTQQEATTNDDLMYAYSGTETTRTNALSNFVSGDWFTIPFVPKMRAKEIQNIGGGSTGDVTFDGAIVQGTEYELGLSPDSTFTSGEASADGPDLGPQYFRIRGGDDYTHLHFDTNDNTAFDLYVGDDNKYFKLSKNGPAIIGTTNGTSDTTWTFNTSGGLVFPDNTTQTTAYTGQVGAGTTGWALIYGGNKFGTGGENNWQDFDGSVTDGAGNTYFYGGTYAWTSNANNTNQYRPLIAKVNSSGVVVWSTVILDYYGRATAAQHINGAGDIIVLFTEDETDNTTTKQWTYNVNVTDGSLTYPSYTIPSQAGAGVVIKDAWTFDINGSGTVMGGWAGFTTGENRIVTLTIMSDPAPGTQSFSVLKTDVPGLTSGNYASCFVDSTNTITSIDDHTSYWTVHVGTPADFTTGSHTIQIPQYSNATLGISSMGPSGWITVGTAGNTHEYYTSSASDFGNSVTYAVGYNEFGDSIVSKIDWSFEAVWHKSINFGESTLRLTGVAVYDGYVYTVGDNDDGSGLITKMDGTGAVIWQRRLTSNGPWGWGEFSIAIGQSGEIIVASGSHSSFMSQDQDIFIIRFNAAGDQVWQRTLASDWADNAGADWENWSQGGTRFVSADGSDYFLALAIRTPNGPDVDAGAVKLPLDGSGLGSWGSGSGIWTYAATQFSVDTVDVTGGSTSITDLIVSNFNTTSGSGSTPNVYTVVGPQNTTAIGNAPAVGIDRHSVDNGDTTTTLDATQNGKFIYFNNDGGNSTIIVPNNDNVQLPIGYVVTLVLDQFDGNTVWVNTNEDNSSGLIINATGFNVNSNTYSYWAIGGDGKAGIYTLMKVDTNRWILSGPNVNTD